MEYRNHGGGCCGISHVAGFEGGRDNHRQLRRNLRTIITTSHGENVERVLEAVVTDNQLAHNRFLGPILASEGFELVRRFKNANTDNICNIFQRHPDFLPLDDLPFSLNPAEAPELVPNTPAPTRGSLAVGQVVEVINPAARCFGHRIVISRLLNAGTDIEFESPLRDDPEGHMRFLRASSVRRVDIDYNRPVEFVDGTPAEVGGRADLGQYSVRALRELSPEVASRLRGYTLTGQWYYDIFGRWISREAAGVFLRNVVDEPVVDEAAIDEPIEVVSSLYFNNYQRTGRPRGGWRTIAECRAAGPECRRIDRQDILSDGTIRWVENINTEEEEG